MKNDTLIRIEGMKALMEKLGMVEAERFIMLIRRESFNYTHWQENLFDGMSVETISAEAAAHRARTEPQKKKKAVHSGSPKANKPMKRQKAVKV